MGEWAARLQRLSGWRRLLAAFLAGGISVLALAPFNLWPILLLTLPVLVLLIDGFSDSSEERWQRFRQAFGLGWAFGLGYFLFGLYWIGGAFLVDAGTFAIFLPLAILVMPAGLALFYGLAVMISALYWRPGLSRLLVLAVAFAVTEWLRGHILTGFPWNALGYAFAGESGLSQLSSLFGPYALTFFAVLLFTLPLLSLQRRLIEGIWNLNAILPGLAAILLLVVFSGWGHLRLLNAPDASVDGIKLRIVQPNVAQKDKWRRGNAGPIYQTMLRLSARASKTFPNGLDQVTHLIWPETALPFLMARSKEALSGIDELLPDNVKLITGSLRIGGPDPNQTSNQQGVYNSLFVLNGKAQLKQVFDKKHLVPFGEYLPLEKWLGQLGMQKLVAIKSSFQSGIQPRLVQAAGTPAFAPLICYEVVFPHEIIEGKTRPKWLINVTNDAWYGVSTGPYQHLQQARTRAIETGLPLVRAANTGVSAIIDPYGRIRQSLPLETAGIIDGNLPAAAPETVYARYGGWLFALILILAPSVAVFTGRSH